MPHIELPPGLPGISGLLAYSPETARPLMLLAQTLLRAPSTLTPGERELVAACVSGLNECDFCARSHAGAAQALLENDAALVEQVRNDYESAPITPKLKALLAIAAKVTKDPRKVSPDDIARARAEEATDREIHDVVLIAAAFCMYNRYVDGLGTWTPDDPGMYLLAGQRLAEHGYAR